MSTPHIDDTTAANTGLPAQVRFVAPETSGWPTHWPRPTAADLAHLEDQYRRGFLPPHAPLLRQPVPPLRPGSEQCHQVVSRLWQAMREQADTGAGITVGLAAPQLGIEVAAILFDPRSQVTGPPTLEELRCVINPAIRPVGEDRTRDVDGCLSTGTLRGWVTRAARIRLIGATPDGELVQPDQPPRQPAPQPATVHRQRPRPGAQQPDRDRHLIQRSTAGHHLRPAHPGIRQSHHIPLRVGDLQPDQGAMCRSPRPGVTHGTAGVEHIMDSR